MSNKSPVDPEHEDGYQTDTEQSPGILFNISNQAHEHVKSKTTYLTSLRDLPPAPEKSLPGRGDVSKGIHAHPARYSYHERLHSWQGGEHGGAPPFAKDYARIVHSPSFRRLQGKTQLIPAGENEFFRTRLTHSLEVAEIATRIARKINSDYDYFKRNRINLELVSCACLLHDIGHAPFGHSGEDILNEKMEKFGGFEGNAQTLRIITKLENRLGRGRTIAQTMNNPLGLNLTIGTLASVLKYDCRSSGPTHDGGSLRVTKGYYPSEEEIVTRLRGKLAIDNGVRLYTIECQIMDMADDIAYSAYDLEDAMEAGIIAPFDLMSVDDKTIDLIKIDVQKGFAKRDETIAISSPDILRHLTDVFGSLLTLAEGDRPYDLNGREVDRLAFVGRTYAESLLHARNSLVRRQYLETLIEQNIASVYLDFNRSCPFLSTLKMEHSRLIVVEAMKSFNFHKVITSRQLQLQRRRHKKLIGDIFDALAGDEAGVLLSDFQRRQLEECDGDHPRRMRLIADIISSLTDLEALNVYDQLNSSRDARFWSYSRQ